MFGLPQAGLIANELLEKRLANHVYNQNKLVPGLWSHEWRPTQFTLVINDFGAEYVIKEHGKHLIYALQENYTITRDWEGKLYVKITLYWDRENHQVHLLMPVYIKAALQHFNHTISTKLQYSPFTHTPQKYELKYNMQKNQRPLNLSMKKERSLSNK